MKKKRREGLVHQEDKHKTSETWMGAQVCQMNRRHDSQGPGAMAAGGLCNGSNLITTNCTTIL